MYTMDETNDILDEIADAMPTDLYRELSGGIILLPQAKIHPQAVANDLYILGEYCRSSIGSCIKLYYGSFHKLYDYLPYEQYREQLRKVLAHELRHHNETLAGCEDLLVYDHNQISTYLQTKEREKQNAIKREQMLNQQG
ncbi:MAG TPA: metallopeptidase family protein [Clostridiales bacterium]|nr:metallopeptidase family protein [Clostridiales bacterium]